MQPRSTRRRSLSDLASLLCCSGLLAACGTVRPPPSTAPDAVIQPPAPKSPAAVVPRSAIGGLGLPPAGSGRGGYYLDDGPGDAPPPNLEATPDAMPKLESYSTRGNKPYVVFGKTYTPVTDNQPMKQRGMGSWYGKKFHGQKTSSGELYDMYKMTAAHPTLPIPSYARVTNVKNGAQVIVRVNDRGPFHSSRIIDLSYTAALKLGYVGHGSTELEVERLLPDDIARINAQARNAPSLATRTGPAIATSAVPGNAVRAASLPYATDYPSTVAQPVLSGSGQGLQAATDGVSLDDFLKLRSADSSTPTVTNASAAAMILPATPAAPLQSPVFAQPQTPSLTQALTQPPTQSPTQLPAPTPLAPGNADAAFAFGFYLQFGAYVRSVNADQLRLQLLPRWPSGLPLPEVRQSGTIYRVYSGPYASREIAANAAGQLGESPVAQPLIVPR